MFSKLFSQAGQLAKLQPWPWLALLDLWVKDADIYLTLFYFSSVYFLALLGALLAILTYYWPTTSTAFPDQTSPQKQNLITYNQLLLRAGYKKKALLPLKLDRKTLNQQISWSHGNKSGDLEPSLRLFETTLTQMWDTFETTLRQLWDNIKITLRQIWDNFGTPLRQFWDNFESSWR